MLNLYILIILLKFLAHFFVEESSFHVNKTSLKLYQIAFHLNFFRHSFIHYTTFIHHRIEWNCLEYESCFQIRCSFYFNFNFNFFILLKSLQLAFFIFACTHTQRFLSRFSYCSNKPRSKDSGKFIIFYPTCAQKLWRLLHYSRTCVYASLLTLVEMT